MTLDGRGSEVRQIRDGDLGHRRAEEIGRRHPSGAEHDRDIMPRDAGELGEVLCALVRSGIGLGGRRVLVHAANLSAPRGGRPIESGFGDVQAPCRLGD